jgi:hypothetical protein
MMRRRQLGGRAACSSVRLATCGPTTQELIPILPEDHPDYRQNEEIIAAATPTEPWATKMTATRKPCSADAVLMKEQLLK